MSFLSNPAVLGEGGIRPSHMMLRAILNGDPFNPHHAILAVEAFDQHPTLQTEEATQLVSQLRTKLEEDI